MPQYYSEQLLPANIDEVWTFFTNPHNLSKVSPPGEGFEVINDSKDEIFTNQIVVHRIYPLPFIKGKWITKILEVHPKTFFIDEMQKGPFQSWRHKHSFEVIDDGILVKDEVEYKLPLGVLGRLFDFVIRIKLNQSFNYRRKKLEEIFKK